VRRATLTIRGESYVTLETVADCYECEIAWVEQIFALGLLGAGESFEGLVAVPTRMLERVAAIRRLCHYHGVDPTIVELLMREETPE
jgi:hypothetical protein